MSRTQVFISYAGHDAFEASLLQYAIETQLSDLNVSAWTFQRDQSRSQKEIAASLKAGVKASVATMFLISPATLDGGATQWMELAYSDAFEVPVFVLLHHMTYAQLKSSERSVPPLLLSSQCNDATSWRAILGELRRIVEGARQP